MDREKAKDMLDKLRPRMNIRDRLTSMGIRLATWPFVGFDGGDWYHGRDQYGVDYSFCLDTGRWIRWGEPPVEREIDELRLKPRPSFAAECEAVGFVITSETGGPFDNWPAERDGNRFWIHTRIRKITCIRPLSFWTLDDFRDGAIELVQPDQIEQPPRVIQFGVTNAVRHSGATTQRSLMELI